MQFVVERFKTRPGRIQFHLCVALFLSTTMLLIGPLPQEIPSVCKIFAALKYFAYLSAFFWMSAIAIDTYITFASQQFFHRDHDDSIESSTMPSGIDALQALTKFVMKIPVYCIKMDCIIL